MTGTDQHLVVDGSNIATEGRSLPSLSQLVEAVMAIDGEYEYESLTVIVDATFAHRIDESERDEFEAAVSAGEIVTPPAGAIGRGDAFILQVAAKAGAVVFSNDSFQEFHGDHDWLFDTGRLIGGKPIAGVGWIFVERAPVRGPTSRRAVREAEERSGRSTPRPTASRSRTRAAAPPGPTPKPTAKTPPPAAKSASSGRRANSGSRPAAKGAAAATTTKRAVEELNDARAFMSFVSSYSIGDEAEAVVERFSSHGCYLRAASARCYLPSRAMGDPAPTRARDVVGQGQTVIVKVESLDSERRGINVSLVRVVEGEQQTHIEEEGTTDSRVTRSRRRNPANSPQHSDGVADDSDREGYPTRRATTVATKKPANKTAAKKTAAKKTTAVKKVATPRAAAAKKTTAARAATPRATTAKKTAKKTATPRTATPARGAAAKTAAQATPSARVKRATAKKAATPAAAKKAGPAKKAPVAKKAAPAKKATAAKKTATPKAPVAKKAAPAKEATPAKKTATPKAAAAKKAAPAKKAQAAKKTATPKAAAAKKATPAKKTTARRAAAKR